MKSTKLKKEGWSVYNLDPTCSTHSLNPNIVQLSEEYEYLSKMN